ncbi:MAG: response regulator transcription factor [Pyrinomonadaceae bacterium]|jgi:DNA-binding NarL/FixJ family response regulator|nr:response regulator transcription factor [Pyrinomonadaceae bacterium]
MKILIIENENLVRLGIRTVISQEKDFEIIGEAETSKQGLEIFKAKQPDVTLISLRLKETCAIDDIEKFLAVNSNAKIIVLASHAGDGEISNTLKKGALGYLLKDVSSNELVKAIRQVNNGKKYIPNEIAKILSQNLGQEELTQTEKIVLRMIVGAMSNKEIAFALDISENTVKTHVKNIFGKLDVSDRTAATTVAIKRGLVRIDV